MKEIKIEENKKAIMGLIFKYNLEEHYKKYEAVEDVSADEIYELFELASVTAYTYLQTIVNLYEFIKRVDSMVYDYPEVDKLECFSLLSKINKKVYNTFLNIENRKKEGI